MSALDHIFFVKRILLGLMTLHLCNKNPENQFVRFNKLMKRESEAGTKVKRKKGGKKNLYSNHKLLRPYGV